jgi:autotransporter-associated beta strand protein
MSVCLRRSISILGSLAVSIALCAFLNEARAVSVTTFTYAIDCGPMVPLNPDKKGPITIVSATNAVSAIQSNTNRAHAQAAATSKIVGGVVIKSVTGTSWVDATLPSFDTKGATWSASASGTTLCVEPMPGQPQQMVDFQFQTPDVSGLTLEALGYSFSTPGYHPPTLQGIKRDPLPPTLPTNSFFNIAGTMLVKVHQDGDGVNPPVDFTFLDGGFIINSTGQVTLTGTRPPQIFNQGGTAGVDLSFAPMASPVFQIRSGVPVELTTEISLGMENGPLGMGLAFPNLAAALGGGISYATQFAKVNDPTNAFTIFAIDSTVSQWSGGSGSWAGGTSWSAPTNSIDGVANFSTANITADATVTLDGNFTVGKILFADLVPSHNWAIAPGVPAGSLMLKTTTGAPTIDVANPTVAPPTNSTGGTLGTFTEQTATISAPLGGGQGLTKAGSGTLILAAQNTYLGPTNVALGGLTLDFSNAAAPPIDIVNPNSLLTLGGGAVVLPSQPAGAVLTVKGGNSATNVQSFGSTMLNDGLHVIRVNESPTGNITLNLGALSHTPTGTVTFLLPTNGQVTTSTANTNGILGGWATVLTTTTGPTTATVDWAENDGTGKIRAYNAYIPVVGAPAAIVPNPLSNVKIDGTTTGPVVVTDPAPGVPTDINSLALKDAVSRQVSVAAGSTLRFGSNGGILKSNALDTTNLSINGGSVTAVGAVGGPSDLYLVANGSSLVATGIALNAVVKDDVIGSLRLIKTGTGAVQLSAPNTYSGGTIVTAGRLNAMNGAALGTGSVAVLNGAQLSVGGTMNNAISIAGNGTSEGGGLGALRVGNANTLFGGVITLTADARISTTISPSTTAFTGKITGSHHLEFGNGMVLGANRAFVLTNSANDYTGNTMVSGATLRAGANNVIPSGAGKGNLILSGIAGTPQPAILDLNGFSQTINGLVSAPGTSSLDSVMGSGTLTLGSANATANFDGTISGSLSLTKIGSGAQTLGGTNTYTGATTVAAGTLALAHANGISAASPVLLQPAAKLSTGGFNQTFASFSPSGGSILDLESGASVFHFDAAQPWTGTFIIRNWDGLLAGGGIDRVTVGVDALATLDFLQSSSTMPPIQFENFDPGFHTVVQMNGEIEVLPNGLPFRMADFTRDNQVTRDDMKPMLAALTNLEAFKLANNLDDEKLKAIADINNDGVVSNRDIQAMINLLVASGTGSLAAVPEPSTMLLGAIGLLTLAAVGLRRNVS